MPRRSGWSQRLLVVSTVLSVAAARPTTSTQPAVQPSAQDPAQPPAPTQEQVAGQGFVVVVHAANPTPSLPREQVARLFLRKVSRWPGGSPSLPVDLRADAPARAAFTKRVLAKSVPSVKAYWQERIFSGRDVPPPEQPSEADAVAYVRLNPGAVAYVSPAAELPRGVRALLVTE
jgi:ABC-type phosphate transport system substrate-binding protein